MATQIGQLAGILSINSKRWTKGLAGAKTSLVGFGKSVGGTIAKVGALGGALLTVGAGAGLAVLVKNSMASIDATSKLADALGTTTEKLTGLGHAASIAGAGPEKLAKGMNFLAKAIGETVSGISTEGIVAFEAAGISLKDLENLDTADVFLKVAESVSKIESPLERAAISARLFGRGGKDLANTLLLGEQGIRDLMAEADALGITFDRAMGAKVEEANDAMTRLAAVFKGISQQIAIQLAPFITELASRFTKFAKEGGGVGTIVTNAFKFISLGIAKTLDFVSFFQAAFKLAQAVVTRAIGGMVKAIQKVGEGMVWLINLVGGNLEMPEFFGMFADDLLRTADELQAKAGAAFEAGMTGARSKAVKKFFNEIVSEADKRAEDVAAAAKDRINTAMGATLEPAESKSASKRNTSFLQGKAARIAFGGGGQGEKKMKIKGDPEQTSILREIVTAVRGIKSTATV